MQTRCHWEKQAMFGIPLILRVSAGSPARNGAVTDLSRSSRLFLVALGLFLESQLFDNPAARRLAIQFPIWHCACKP